MCYGADKDACLTTGRPPFLANEYADLNDADDHVAHQNAASELDEAFSNCPIVYDKLLAFLPKNPHVGLLKEKVFRLLYSPPALGISDSELLNRIRELDDSLESWRISITPGLRPKLAIVSSNVGPDSAFSCLKAIHLQLEYNYLLTMIHTTVRRFGASLEPHAVLPEDIHGVMHSSIDLALGAGRSTIHAVGEPNSILKQDTWYVRQA
jgi:hypothetical protein